MIGQIIFTITAFALFIFILLLKLIKKNDTTYLVILGIQAVGILLNLIKITFDILTGIFSTIILYLCCIIIPVAVFLLEAKNINVSEILSIIMAQIHIWTNNPKKAKKVLINLVSKYKASYRGHKMLAHIYEKEGGMRKAIDEYVQVLDIKKNDYDSYYRISVLLNELGKKSEAAEMLRTLLKNRPQTYGAVKLLGEIYLKQKEFKKAIEVYTNSIKYFPEKYEIYYNLGVCYSRINVFDIAKKCFQKTVELNDDIYLAYYRLGQIALLYRDFEAAEENFAKSLYNEKEAKAYFELAKIHVMKNNKEKAVLDINNAMKIDSSYYEISQKEPVLFPIKQLITKPQNEVKPEYKETEEEKEIEAYLNDTYNLTKILNSQKEGKNGIAKKKRT